MVQRLSNATQRAIRRINGDDTFEILVESPDVQLYKLSLAIPVGMRILSLDVKTSGGSCVLDIEKVDALGVTTDITGLTAVAVTSTRSTTLPTKDGSEVVAQGEQIQVNVTGNTAAADLSVTLKVQRLSGSGSDA